MKHLRKLNVNRIARSGLPRPSVPPRSACRIRATSLCLGLVSTLIATGHCDAQQGTGLVEIGEQGVTVPPLLTSMPLTVRPHDMVLGTNTPRAGEYKLDSLDGYLVYVPKQCVGTHRCPLIIFLHGSGESGKVTTRVWRSTSDKYGTILLAPTAQHAWQRPDEPQDHANLDAALRQVLSKFAIDPDHIALMGNSAAGGATMAFGGYRLDMFSRIMLISSDFSIATVDPKNTTTQFLLSCSINEAHDCLSQGAALRATGHPVAYDFSLREDDSYASEDIDVIGHWLQRSWVITNPAARPAPTVVIRSVPLLTTDMVTKLTAFWRKFKAEPDSIQTTARIAHLRQVAVPVAGKQLSVLMADMPTLAAKYPSVAADLKAAGLTAQQHDSYRITLISARIGELGLYGPVADGPHTDSDDPSIPAKILDSLARLSSGGPAPLSIDPASVQGKNIQFMMTHTGILKELASTSMWQTP